MILNFIETFYWWTCFFLLEEVFSFLLGGYCYLLIKKKNLRVFFTNIYWLVFLSFFLSNNYFFQSNILADICLVDHPSLLNRYSIIYNFWNIYLGIKYQLKFFFNEYSKLFSISKSHISALWLEREVYDLYGIFFFNHTDLRRILTDYGFNSHPFDKTFSVLGYSEVRYNIEQIGVFYNNLEITQEYRFFNFISPWENLQLNK